jgi:ketosteroid isomerase-like protein
LKGGASFDFNERTTDIYKKVDGTWRVMHEHNSVPVDIITGKADLLSTP